MRRFLAWAIKWLSALLLAPLVIFWPMMGMAGSFMSGPVGRTAFFVLLMGPLILLTAHVTAHEAMRDGNPVKTAIAAFLLACVAAAVAVAMSY